MSIGLNWKLRRIAAGWRQRDVAPQIGMSVTKYSAIKRGEVAPSVLDRQLAEQILPPLPKNHFNHPVDSRNIVPERALVVR